jgi:deazaflavin-dependent oxidoreductase (nitroreductase family)
MPVGRPVARFNRLVANRVLRPVMARLPIGGVLAHTGRKSGRPYRTPVLVFRRGDRYVFALIYGANSEWVRNVVANGGATLDTMGRSVRLTRPHLVHDEQRRAMPWFVRPVLGLLDVSDFLALAVDNAATHR